METKLIIGITGSTGFVGKTLTEELKSIGMVVNIQASDGLSKYRLDYPSNITSLNPDVLIHCAMSRKANRTHLDENILGLTRLLDEALGNPKMQIIFISSLSSHSQSSSMYGKSKFYCEELLRKLPNTHVIRVGLITASPPGGFEKVLTRIANIPLILTSISNIQLHITPIYTLVDHIFNIVQNNSTVNSKSIIIAEKPPILLTNFLKTRRSRRTYVVIEFSFSLVLKIIEFAQHLKLSLNLFDSVKSYITPLELRNFYWKSKE